MVDPFDIADFVVEYEEKEYVDVTDMPNYLAACKGNWDWFDSTSNRVIEDAFEIIGLDDCARGEFTSPPPGFYRKRFIKVVHVLASFHTQQEAEEFVRLQPCYPKLSIKHLGKAAA